MYWHFTFLNTKYITNIKSDNEKGFKKNGVQNNIHNIEDWATRTLLSAEGDFQKGMYIQKYIVLQCTG